jgi:hypothetical protein
MDYILLYNFYTERDGILPMDRQRQPLTKFEKREKDIYSKLQGNKSDYTPKIIIDGKVLENVSVGKYNISDLLDYELIIKKNDIILEEGFGILYNIINEVSIYDNNQNRYTILTNYILIITDFETLTLFGNGTRLFITPSKSSNRTVDIMIIIGIEKLISIEEIDETLIPLQSGPFSLETTSEEDDEYEQWPSL